MGTKRQRAKTKTVLKSVNKMEQLVGMPKAKKEKNQNKNHPTDHVYFTAQKERYIAQHCARSAPRASQSAATSHVVANQ